MNGKLAKQLRRLAEEETVGHKESVTKRVYKRFKTFYKQSRIFTNKDKKK